MHRWSLILPLLLTGILFTNVTAADDNDLLFQITSPAPEMTPAEATSDCNATSVELLPLANVIFATGLAQDVCGQCGSTYCWGAQFDDPCGTDGRLRCIPSGTCGGGIPRCYCLFPKL